MHTTCLPSPAFGVQATVYLLMYGCSVARGGVQFGDFVTAHFCRSQGWRQLRKSKRGGDSAVEYVSSGNKLIKKRGGGGRDGHRIRLFLRHEDGQEDDQFYGGMIGGRK